MTEMGVGIQGWRVETGSVRTKDWKPMARRQVLRKLCSKVNQMNCPGKRMEKIARQKAGISTLCLGLDDKISSGSLIAHAEPLDIP